MGEVKRLPVREAVRVDTRRVQNIVSELGEVAAEGVIQLAIEQMAQAMRQLQDQDIHEDAETIARRADRLSRLAWQIGLMSLAGVAVDVADCARRGDQVALRATMARASRVATRSLTEVWDGVAL